MSENIPCENMMAVSERVGAGSLGWKEIKTILDFADDAKAAGVPLVQLATWWAQYREMFKEMLPQVLAAAKEFDVAAMKKLAQEFGPQFDAAIAELVSLFKKQT